VFTSSRILPGSLEFSVLSRTAFITGTSSGLGLSMVRYFAERGWNVAATMRRKDRMNLFADLPSVHVILMELTDAESVVEAFQTALRHFGHIDVLVNNAGYCLLGPLEATSMEQIRQQYETNIFGLMNMIKICLPHFREAGGGRIINIASISADIGYPFVSSYSATKAAVAMLSEVLNIELHEVGIQVKAVHPGLFETEIFDSDKLQVSAEIPQAYQPLSNRFTALQKALPAGDPDDCACVVFRAANDNRPNRVHYYAGRDATLLCRLKRLLGPESAFSMIKNIFIHGPSWWMKWLVPASGKSTPSVKNATIRQ
jgi:NAD(P)-dependent dehydrogenase (short-subunit alcohol dehydrogenase family)